MSLHDASPPMKTYGEKKKMYTKNDFDEYAYVSGESDDTSRPSVAAAVQTEVANGFHVRDVRPPSRITPAAVVDRPRRCRRISGGAAASG